MEKINSLPLTDFLNLDDVENLVLNKPIFLYVYEIDESGNILEYEATNVDVPKEDCLTFKIGMEESLQIDKLKVVTTYPPKLVEVETLKDIKIDKYGIEPTE